MIKYIVQTTSSYSDLNGNTYHFARITSTKTKNSIVISEVGGTSNAAGLLFRLKLAQGWHEIYDVQVWEKRRDWQRKLKHAHGFNGDISDTVYEHEVTAKMIRALNRNAKLTA